MYLNGVLNIDKPAGVTSRDVVNSVQRLVRPAKAGHAGTLDPLATGVVVVAVGGCTRLIEYIQQLPKTYRALFLLGRTSDTEDVEGSVTLLEDRPIPTRADLEATLTRFTGRILQRPPAFSALKLRGRRAYSLARQGEAFELAPRPVDVHRLGIERYDYPELALEIVCGSGTYVRSLGRDIALAAGTGAVMAALVRESVGDFRRTASLPLADLTATTLEQHLQPALAAVAHLPSVILDEASLGLLRVGAMAPRQGVEKAEEPASPHADSQQFHVAAINQAGELAAIVVARQKFWAPVKNLLG